MLTIATANTQEARLLQQPDGLKPFVDAGVDVLLLQEVLGVEDDFVHDKLQREGFTVAHLVGVMGLAVATRQDSEAIVGVGELKTIDVDSPREAAIVRHIGPIAGRVRPRGLIAAEINLLSGERLAAASTHPIVFARPLVRKRQIRDMIYGLDDPYFDGALVLGADMNHYPGPHGIDRRLQLAHNLARVAIDEPTWYVTGSKHEKWAKIGSLFTGKPLTEFDGYLDALLYRNLDEVTSQVIDIESDHRSIVTTFNLS